MTIRSLAAHAAFALTIVPLSVFSGSQSAVSEGPWTRPAYSAWAGKVFKYKHTTTYKGETLGGQPFEKTFTTETKTKITGIDNDNKEITYLRWDDASKVEPVGEFLAVYQTAEVPYRYLMPYTSADFQHYGVTPRACDGPDILGAILPIFQEEPTRPLKDGSVVLFRTNTPDSYIINDPTIFGAVGIVRRVTAGFQVSCFKLDVQFLVAFGDFKKSLTQTVQDKLDELARAIPIDGQYFNRDRIVRLYEAIPQEFWSKAKPWCVLTYAKDGTLLEGQRTVEGVNVFVGGGAQAKCKITLHTQLVTK